MSPLLDLFRCLSPNQLLKCRAVFKNLELEQSVRVRFFPTILIFLIAAFIWNLYFLAWKDCVTLAVEQKNTTVL